MFSPEFNSIVLLKKSKYEILILLIGSSFFLFFREYSEFKGEIRPEAKHYLGNMLPYSCNVKQHGFDVGAVIASDLRIQDP